MYCGPPLPLRHEAIQTVRDPFVKGALIAFDNLSDRIKAEQTSSTISRLEMFLCDELVRQVICSPHSLDLEQLLDDRKIILVNFGRYQPLLPDTLKLLGRFFFNDLLAQIFKAHGEGKMDENNPCYVLCDEIQNFATKMVCDCLDEGRGIGCHMTIAHQHLSQLADEDQSGYLYSSVVTDARTKVIFPGLSPADLQVLADTLMLKHFNPLRIKHMQRTPVFVPVETVREIRTRSMSNSVTQSRTESLSEGDSVSHSVQRSVSNGRSVGDSIAESQGEHQSHTHSTNSSVTNSRNWGTTDTVSGAKTRSKAHTAGTAESQGRNRGSSRSTGTTDSTGRNSSAGWSEGESSTDSSGRSAAAGSSQNSGTNITNSSGEGQVMLPQEERMFDFLQEDPTVLTTSTNTGSAEGRSSSAGSNKTEGSSSGHADSRTHGKNGMVGSSAAHARSTTLSDNDSTSHATSVSNADTTGESMTDGWTSSTNAGGGIADQTGEADARSLGTDQSTTRAKTVTDSVQVTDGLSNTIGKTTTRGTACTEGDSVTHGEAVAVTPFHEYRREEIESPVFLTPEEQKLLEMQKLANPQKRQAVLLTPTGVDYAFRMPHVPTPMMSHRRRAARLKSVHTRESYYMPVAHHDHDAGRDARTTIVEHDNAGGVSDDDVIDVEVEEVANLQPVAALPSPAPVVQPESEESLWKRLRAMSFGRKHNP